MVATATAPQQRTGHRLRRFWVLTFAFSWAYWVPLAVWAPHVSHFPGLLGPLLAAVVLVVVDEGRPGLRRLLRRAGRWRLPGRLWLAALVPVATAAVVLAVLVATGRSVTLDRVSRMDGLPAVGLLGLVALVLVVNGFGEEVGWRGYAWPRLRATRGVGPAALALAVPWALWHLPTLFLDTGLKGFPLLTVPGWLIGLTAGCVVLGHLYETGRSSLLLVAVFHTGLNLGSATPATEGLPAAVVSAVVIVWAVLLLRAPGAGEPLASAAEP